MIKLEKMKIRVRVLDANHHNYGICGTVIGSYGGMYGVLLENGEYMDIPKKLTRIVYMEICVGEEVIVGERH